MGGAGCIDVEAQCYPPRSAGWVIVYPPGRCITPDTPVWRELRQRVEAAATTTLAAAGAPF